MITTPQEYQAQLYILQSQNPRRLAVLQTAETTHDIILETREINSPQFLSVKNDHKSETIYFKVDRFFDYMDLATTTCIVQYTNAEGKSGIYVVPFYDVVTCAKEHKMLLPWCIDGRATAAAGAVEYSVRFYKISDDGKQFLYNLSTLPAKSKVLHGMNTMHNNAEYDLAPTEYEHLLSLINEVQKRDVYWIEV